jgi:hypothetical protein
MSTWVGAIIETAGRADFWAIARKHGVIAQTQALPKFVLIDCEPGLGFFEASFRLAEAMSKDLGAMAIGFVAQTAVDVHQLHVFNKGSVIRQLDYVRDEGGWLEVQGTAQPWERAYFFDDDMLSDELSEEEKDRYEAARRAGDASGVMDLMHPSSTEPLCRVCATFDLRPDQPLGRWKKRSLFSRLFRRS